MTQSSAVALQDYEEHQATRKIYLVAAPPRMFAVIATEKHEVYVLPVIYFRERDMERTLFRRTVPPDFRSGGKYRLHEIMVIADAEHGKTAVRELGEAIDLLDSPRGCRVVAANWPPSEDHERFLAVAGDIIAGRAGYYTGAVPGPEAART